MSLFRNWISWLVWVLIALAGAFSLMVLSLVGGEEVNALWMLVASLCTFAIAYRFHSAWLMAKVLTLDDMRATPAHVQEDGKDFVPTNRWVVFGHHFAAIAGPGPLVGPVLAAQFGYLPGMLWILVGATLGGAVHDSIILFCSIRRRGKSLGQMVRDEVGPFAGLVTQISVTLIMIIILAVLALVVVNALAESPWGLFTIAASMPIAMVMGLAMRFTKTHIALITVCGVLALLLAVAAGPWIQSSPFLSHALTLKGTSLAWAVMAYGLLASILPIWLLLAPRDYLSTFMKIGVVGLLALAIIVIAPPLKMPALTSFVSGGGLVFAGPVFPFCFITIACAAISGFHALIASGTTPKLLSNEKDIRIVGYGAMVTEMLVGIMALIAACSMPPGEYFAINMKGEPAAVVQKVNRQGFSVTEDQMADLAQRVGEHTMIGRAGGAPTFAVGMAAIFGRVLGNSKALSLWYHFAIMFEALFILTTIDAGTRVGRFLVQDLLGYMWKPLGRTDHLAGSSLASLLFVAAWGYFLYMGVIDPLGGINSLWPVFGVANQLLAVIALSLGTTVLVKMGRVRWVWVPLLPLGWLLTITMTAGWMKIFSPDLNLGFLSAAAKLREKLAAGAPNAHIEETWERLVFGHMANTAVTATFLLLVLLVVGANIRIWWKILAMREIETLHEDPYVAQPLEVRNPTGSS